MNDHSVFHRVPDATNDRDYDLFEEFPDGSTIWRGSVFGMQNVKSRLRKLAEGSRNNFFAINLHDRDMAIIRSQSVTNKSTDGKKLSAQKTPANDERNECGSQPLEGT